MYTIGGKLVSKNFAEYSFVGFKKEIKLPSMAGFGKEVSSTTYFCGNPSDYSNPN
jgi:hypothetical protein